MISRNVKNSQNRLPLGEISQKIYSSGNTSHKFAFESSKKQAQLSLNEKQSTRLQQLKYKYTKPKAEQSFKEKQNKFKDSAIEFSFNQIQISQISKKPFQMSRNLTIYQSIGKENFQSSISSCKNSIKSSKSSFIREDFSRKVQESNERIQRKIDTVQDKLRILKGFIHQNSIESQKKQQSQFNRKAGRKTYESSMTPKYVQQQIFQIGLKKSIDVEDNYVKAHEKARQIKEQSNLSEKSNYASQLKNINYIDEIKKKLNQIQNEKKRNIQKKLSRFSQQSCAKDSNANSMVKDILQKAQDQSVARQRMTLANLTPNLAQSQIIQITDRCRNTDRESVNSQDEASSLVIKCFKIQSGHNQGKRRTIPYSDKIVEEVQLEDKSLASSPLALKSPFQQSGLEETQMIQRNSLQGDLDIVEETIENQFTLLINRLAYQAELDNHFASEIYAYENIYIPSMKDNLKNVILQKVTSYCNQKNIQFHPSMFEVSQMQIDPLASVNKTSKQIPSHEISKISLKIKQNYERTTSYFANKLQKHYSKKTIDFFVKQLQKCHSLSQNEAINVGHLTSYINMRTGKNLRNRCFYRILKRLSKENNRITSSLKKQELFAALVKLI